MVKVKMPDEWLGEVVGSKALTLPFNFTQTGFITLTVT
jgi:hypothetical protein